jgi:hypothetical protein
VTALPIVRCPESFRLDLDSDFHHSVSIKETSITIYSPTDISCIRTATTSAPYPAPFGTLAARGAAPETTTTSAPANCPTVSPITIIPPTISAEPCTCIEGGYALTYVRETQHSLTTLLTMITRTDTVTVTTKGVSTTTSTPTKIHTVTETWIQPTPTSYNGIL